MSVLVDERFGGSLGRPARRARGDDAAAARQGLLLDAATTCETAREAGADAVLLLLRDLDDAACATLLARGARARPRHARRGARRGRARSARRARRAGDRRSTRATSRRSRSTAARQLELLARAPRDRIVIAESAIETRAQAAAAELAGANAVLVGSTLMRAPDPGAKLARAAVAAARQGVRPDAPGGRRRRRRGRRRPRRLHPRRREPAPHRRAARRAATTVLRVAVFVGEREETDADLVQFYAREDGHRARDAALLRARRAGRHGRRPAVGASPTRRTSSAPARPPAA